MGPTSRSAPTRRRPTAASSKPSQPARARSLAYRGWNEGRRANGLVGTAGGGVGLLGLSADRQWQTRPGREASIASGMLADAATGKLAFWLTSSPHALIELGTVCWPVPHAGRGRDCAAA
jgi:hypothetical protein